MKLGVEGVSVRLGATTILHDIDLHVGHGDIVGLIGPNGSGKTTLLRTIYRSIRPDSGVVRVDGDDLWRLSPREAARRTAAVLQSGPAPVGLTVAGVVALGRNPHHGLLSRDTSNDQSVIREALERVGMYLYRDRLFSSLSGGERQRVLVARALAQQPRMLLLDEPTNHLDIRARFELLDLVRTIGMTTLAVLHDLDLAARSCEQLVVMNHGRVVAAGAVLDVLTPSLLRDVFGVVAASARGADGVIRITYDAQPLAHISGGLLPT